MVNSTTPRAHISLGFPRYGRPAAKTHNSYPTAPSANTQILTIILLQIKSYVISGTESTYIYAHKHPYSSITAENECLLIRMSTSHSVIRYLSKYTMCSFSNSSGKFPKGSIFMEKYCLMEIIYLGVYMTSNNIK